MICSDLRPCQEYDGVRTFKNYWKYREVFGNLIPFSDLVEFHDKMAIFEKMNLFQFITVKLAYIAYIIICNRVKGLPSPPREGLPIEGPAAILTSLVKRLDFRESLKLALNTSTESNQSIFSTFCQIHDLSETIFEGHYREIDQIFTQIFISMEIKEFIRNFLDFYISAVHPDWRPFEKKIGDQIRQVVSIDLNRPLETIKIEVLYLFAIFKI